MLRFLVLQLAHICAFLQLASFGSSQGCQLWYVKEPPSTISCNVNLTRELDLTCELQATKSIGERVVLQWFFTNTDNVTKNVIDVNNIYRRFSTTTRTKGNQWDLTANLSLQQFTFPNHAGKWFCQAVIDGQPVNPSNKLFVGEAARTGMTECSDIQFQDTRRCAYFTPSNSTSPTSVSTAAETSSTTLADPTASTVASTAPTSEPATTVSTTSVTTRADITQRIATVSTSPEGMQVSTALGIKQNNTQRTPTTDHNTRQPAFTWVYVLASIVAFFAVIIVILVVLFIVFFVLKRRANQKPVPSTSSYNLAHNSAYCAPKDLAASNPVSFNGSTPLHDPLEDPLYAEIPTVLSESSYIYPDENTLTAFHKDKKSDTIASTPGNEYVEHSEYLVLKV